MVRPAEDTGRVGEADIWRWLGDVPDPELPVVSVVDLGMVRAVRCDGPGRVTIAVTPTYAACPATAVIARDIETALKARGLADIRIETQLAPAWTTDWISADGRRKLREYGIAPPIASGTCAGMLARRIEGPVHCPRCDSSRTECVSMFGSTPCKAAYRCSDCREPFDYFKSF